MLDRGCGAEKDPEEAAVWFGKAAKKGYVDAYLALGAAYVHGSGVHTSVSLGQGVGSAFFSSDFVIRVWLLNMAPLLQR